MVEGAADRGAAIVWFRDDLRLADNPALTEAARSGLPVIALYILDEAGDRRPLGAASRWWLHGSLAALRTDLNALGIPLVLRRGDPRRILPDIAREAGAAVVAWNRRYGKAEIDLDAGLKTALSADGIRVASCNGALLVEPWTVANKSGGYFRVFSPFWRACLPLLDEVRSPLPVPAMAGRPGNLESDRLEDWALLPTRPDWAGGLRSTWTPGEAGARARLDHFLDEGLARYADERDAPAAGAVSMLSPHLRFGEISPVAILAAVETYAAAHALPRKPVEKFVAELGWREFSYNLLYHFPDLGRRNFQPRFDDFPWRSDAEADLKRWQAGRTGYPMVDAGMRQLWQTGFMHNRVRMIVASFLVKHLLIDWRLGEAWFWNTLVDADPANNAASWQWVAGSGADAAPYFRVFNPISQGEKFDPDGTYVRTYVPELSDVPAEAIHAPWQSGELGRNRSPRSLRTYPEPIVDHAMARDRALAAFDRLRPAA